MITERNNLIVRLSLICSDSQEVRMRTALLPAILATLVLAAPAGAQQPVKKVSDEPTKMICKRAKPTGTRLGGRRVCATQEQWRQREKDDQELVNRMQAESRLATVD